MSITKAPGFDTLRLTEEIEKALAELEPTLPAGVKPTLLFRQGDFIEHAIGNLKEAIRDGAIMVTIVLFLFLLNFRTTFITLMAMPLSFAITLLAFKWFDISVNSMTLGGLAVAIGMVVDDAIVDMENVWRRLRENAALPKPHPRLKVIAQASGEVRNSILYATLLIILVFLPLLGLSGVEGKLFAPIAIATIISMVASFIVSLAVIPVLCSFLLNPKPGKEHKDGFVTRFMKWLLENTLLRFGLSQPYLFLTIVADHRRRRVFPLSEDEQGLPARIQGGNRDGLRHRRARALRWRRCSRFAPRLEEEILQVPEVRQSRPPDRPRRAGRPCRPGFHPSSSMWISNEGEGRKRSEVLEEIRQRVRHGPRHLQCDHRAAGRPHRSHDERRFRTDRGQDLRTRSR